VDGALQHRLEVLALASEGAAVMVRHGELALAELAHPLGEEVDRLCDEVCRRDRARPDPIQLLRPQNAGHRDHSGTRREGADHVTAGDAGRTVVRHLSVPPRMFERAAPRFAGVVAG
jgi:hypothetical protein